MNYDFYFNYKTNSDQIFRETNNKLKSYVKLKGGFVKNKTKELNGHKNFVKSYGNTYTIGDINKIKQISRIFDNFENFANYLEKLNLPKYSFGIWIKFKLNAPYFSKDDDEFYIIQNPIIKDYAFKVPMVRPSSWKGALANTFREILKEKDLSEKRILIESYLRIFGAGSEEIKTIENYLKEKSKNLDKLKKSIINFILFELGLTLDIETINKIKNANSETQLFENLKDKISEKLEDLKKDKFYPTEFQTHKGRLIIFPTYFDQLSLEIINYHDRRKRAGINPVYYEVVPKEAEGILQMVYVPYDGLLKSGDELKKEMEQDLKYLCQAINKLAGLGIGAKTKLGWGRFELEEKFCLVLSNLENESEINKLGFEIRVINGE
ncbi:protein of unknown function DUF324 [Methanocaldococcus infernus ME]|uniref:CRISPR type III-associated protein domain-containing protein n=1 Tax=Methanocaldococcus infernus (strain DSM 11812 / JCM 15783 / ME) TaxID=573063 RepID=D5VQI4_METIM|nr:RAMP superfamily CRISPR-associated protein [Methanocaldococcus infernus]ADG12837.1 protein of unknown function DUF324 [Methanocaldococcus infernus ME]